jgi:CheY-like chemotaxis protein
VVLLALGLPSRSGARLLAELKAGPATAAIPVAIVSAAPDALPAEYRRLAAAILAKPVSARRPCAVVHATLTAPPPPAPPGPPRHTP